MLSCNDGAAVLLKQGYRHTHNIARMRIAKPPSTFCSIKLTLVRQNEQQQMIPPANSEARLDVCLFVTTSTARVREFEEFSDGGECYP